MDPVTRAGGTKETRLPLQYTHRQILVIMSGLMMGLMLAALDQTIVTTALTRISEDFRRPDLYSWVVTSYLLTSTATTPLYGRLSDLRGRKRIFQFAIIVFLIGSALCGLSQNMFQLIFFRAAQGLGAGGLISLAQAVIGDVVSPRDRGKYQGFFTLVFALSSVAGPLVGGSLVQGPGWRWVFYINLPLGAVALAVINRVLRDDRRRLLLKIDWAGAVLLVSGVSAILVGVSQVGNAGTVTRNALAFVIVGTILVAAFIFWETKAAVPILPMYLFRNDVFRVTTSLTLVSGAILYGSSVLLPQYLQVVRGISPTQAGLHLTPMLGGVLVSSIASGRLISGGASYKKFVVCGSTLTVTGTALYSHIHVGTNFWALSGALCLTGIGAGMTGQILVTATQNAVPKANLGIATSSLAFFRTLGGAIGASALGAILIAESKATRAHEVAVATRDAVAAHGSNAASIALGRSIGAKHAFVNGMDRAYLWAMLFAILAFALSFALREVKLRETAHSAPAATPSPAETNAI